MPVRHGPAKRIWKKIRRLISSECFEPAPLSASYCSRTIASTISGQIPATSDFACSGAASPKSHLKSLESRSMAARRLIAQSSLWYSGRRLLCCLHALREAYLLCCSHVLREAYLRAELETTIFRKFREF